MARPTSMRAALPGIARFARHFAPFLKGHYRLVLLAMAALLGQAVLRLLEPWPLKFVIDRVVRADSGGRTHVEWLAAMSVGDFLLVIGLSLVAIVFFRAWLGYASTIGFALIGNRVLAEIREQVFRHLQTLSLAFHESSRGGDLVVRMIGDIGMVREVVVTAVLPLLGNILVLAGMLGVMFWLHWQLALIALATTPVLWLMTLKKSAKIQVVARKNRKREGAMAATAAESIGAIKTVQAMSLHETFMSAFSSANSQSLKEGVQGKRLNASLIRNVDVLIAVATALVLGFGSLLVLKGELTPGEMLVFIFYLRRVFRPLRDFAKYTARLAKASSAGERVLEILEKEPGVTDRPDAIPAPPFQGEIAFSQVEFGYLAQSPVLQQIDLQIKPGERLALVGQSGSGKSTLAGLLMRLYDPWRGSVLIDGRDIRDYTLASLRDQVSVVLQDSVLFAGTLADNIAGGREGLSQSQIEAAARLANAHDFIAQLPEGYETQVGERGVTLSNGQRQRIAIARAVIRNTPILILDEPTTGLDPENERLVTEALDRLTHKRTTLIITHRPDTAAQADRVAYLVNGKIEAQGSHRQMLESCSAYARLFQLNGMPVNQEERQNASSC